MLQADQSAEQQRGSMSPALSEVLSETNLVHLGIQSAGWQTFWLEGFLLHT